MPSRRQYTLLFIFTILEVLAVTTSWRRIQPPDFDCARYVFSLPCVPVCSQVDWRSYKVICDMPTREPGFECKDKHCKNLDYECIRDKCNEVGYMRCWPESSGNWRCGCTPTAFTTYSNAMLFNTSDIQRLADLRGDNQFEDSSTTSQYENLSISDGMQFGDLRTSCPAEIFPANATRDEFCQKVNVWGVKMGNGVTAGDRLMCSLGTVIKEISVMSLCGRVNTGSRVITGLALGCDDAASGAPKGNLTYGTDGLGEWMAPIVCLTPITGMRIRMLTPYGPVTDVEPSCEVQDSGLGGYGNDMCYSLGEWQPWIHCSEGHIVCGIQTWTQKTYQAAEYKNVTDIDLYCCPQFI